MDEVEWKLDRIVNKETLLKSDIEDQANVPDIRGGQVFENGDEVEQLIVVGVREPAADGDRVLRVEDVRGRGVVDNDRVLQVTAHLRQVLHVVTLMVVAALPEKPVMDNVVDVQLVEERIAILSTISIQQLSSTTGSIVPWTPTR